ncbi:hypothetical protein G7046_g4833 [Stylonectria norvegica]|nr:hypothetical protein G7046_g4833 [Stylonectria norvegica]
MSGLDNANPTILSASQLPTRQKKIAPHKGPESRFNDLVFAKPSYLSRPFSDAEPEWPRPNYWHDDFAAEPIDEQEVYDLISTISDPEHPVSLGQLSVINLCDIHITPAPTLGMPGPNTIVQVVVQITPTITHCSLATVIGLGVRVRLEQTLPPNYRVDVTCKENSHNQDDQVNKQLGDKERVAAALENDTLKGVLDKMLETYGSDDIVFDSSGFEGADDWWAKILTVPSTLESMQLLGSVGGFGEVLSEDISLPGVYLPGLGSTANTTLPELNSNEDSTRGNVSDMITDSTEEICPEEVAVDNRLQTGQAAISLSYNSTKDPAWGTVSILIGLSSTEPMLMHLLLSASMRLSAIDRKGDLEREIGSFLEHHFGVGSQLLVDILNNRQDVEASVNVLAAFWLIFYNFIKRHGLIDSCTGNAHAATGDSNGAISSSATRTLVARMIIWLFYADTWANFQNSGGQLGSYIRDNEPKAREVYLTSRNALLANWGSSYPIDLVVDDLETSTALDLLFEVHVLLERVNSYSPKRDIVIGENFRTLEKRFSGLFLLTTLERPRLTRPRLLQIAHYIMAILYAVQIYCSWYTAPRSFEAPTGLADADGPLSRLLAILYKNFSHGRPDHREFQWPFLIADMTNEGSVPEVNDLAKPTSDLNPGAEYNARQSIKYQTSNLSLEAIAIEVQAHDNICNFLESLNAEFRVTCHAHGISTAFTVEYGSGERVIGINAEYDALPGIGHACGHNLIAEAGIATFLGLVAILRESSTPGRVRLIGTPAEEGGGGKLKLINAGAYEDVSICMMVHPYPLDKFPGFSGDAYALSLGNHKFTINALRQQIKPYERMHGVIVSGGTRTNVIIAYTEICYYIRSRTLQEADDLKPRAMKCFEGAAMATGCAMTYEVLNSYADLRPNPTLCSNYASAMEGYGSVVRPNTESTARGGSTDMGKLLTISMRNHDQGLIHDLPTLGNVSYECPGFQAAFGNPTDVRTFNHTLGFTEAAGTRKAHSLALETAKGMALTGWRYLSHEKVANAVHRDFHRDRKLRECL